MSTIDHQPIWSKGTRPADWVTRFTVGDDAEWDTLLLPYDIVASRAHARGLGHAGVLSASRLERILGALDALAADDTVRVTVEDEDCHTVIERYLVNAVGEDGKRIHAGRSRNDQVLAALYLWLRDHLMGIVLQTTVVVERLADLSDRHRDTFLPGYTHLQRAMPSTVALWALGYAECLCDDAETVIEARRRINISPLGSGAGYGVPWLDLPRTQVAEALGFRDIQYAVTAVQLNRTKFAAHVLHAMVQTASTVNRLASDLTLFASSEFGFVHFIDELTTGSSIMPQKRNPDVAELSRAAFHILAADLQLVLTLPAGLPSGYHRDLQVTKAAVMRSVLRTADLLRAAEGLLDGLAFNTEKMNAARRPELYATAAALDAVCTGVPFRDAYRRAVGDRKSWSAQSTIPLQAMYFTEGAPGRTESTRVRARVRTLRDQSKSGTT